MIDCVRMNVSIRLWVHSIYENGILWTEKNYHKKKKQNDEENYMCFVVLLLNVR